MQVLGSTRLGCEDVLQALLGHRLDQAVVEGAGAVDHGAEGMLLGDRAEQLFEGAAVGAILVGLARAASVHLLPQAELFMIYLIMAGVLMFRPEGLFKRETARRI